MCIYNGFKLKIEKYRILELIGVVLFAFLALLNYAGIVSGKILLVHLVISNIAYMFKFKNRQSFIISLIFTLTYWLYLIPYYFFGIPYSSYFTYQNITFSDGTLRITGFFFVLLFFCFNRYKVGPSLKLVRKDNQYIVYSCMLIMAVISLMAFFTGDAFSYNIGDNNSTLYEYYFIFALSAYAFDGNDKSRKLFIILNTIYILVLLRLGLRMVVLQVIFLVFILYYENKFKTIYIYISTIFAFLFFSFWSWVRHGMLKSITSIGFLLGFNDDSLITNQGDVFYTSTAQYAQVFLGYWNTEFRLESLSAFFMNIFLSGSNQFDMGVLNRILNMNVKEVGGGGFGAMYIYVWLGWLGVSLLAIYISYFINSIHCSRNYLVQYYGVFLSFTFFRWYSYSLNIVFKMGLYLIIAFWLLRIINNTIVYKKYAEGNKRIV